MLIQSKSETLRLKSKENLTHYFRTGTSRRDILWLDIMNIQINDFWLYYGFIKKLNFLHNLVSVKVFYDHHIFFFFQNRIAIFFNIKYSIIFFEYQKRGKKCRLMKRNFFQAPRNRLRISYYIIENKLFRN